MNRLKENDCIVSRHVIQIKLSYFSSNNIYTKIIERDKYSNKDKRFNFPISSLNNCNFRFTHFRSFKIQFKRFEIQDSDHENFHLKKKKRSSCSSQILLNQSKSSWWKQCFDQFFETRVEKEETFPRTEKILWKIKCKVRQDQKSDDEYFVNYLAWTKKKEKRKNREKRNKRTCHREQYWPFYSLSFAGVGVLYQGFSVPLDDRQHALYNAVTMLIPDRNVLRCQAKLCGPACQPYNAL